LFVEDYRYEEIPVPVPQPGEVLVKVNIIPEVAYLLETFWIICTYFFARWRLLESALVTPKHTLELSGSGVRRHTVSTLVKI
jgi:hypothetical protein